jgi:hypothetical protein
MIAPVMWFVLIDDSGIFSGKRWRQTTGIRRKPQCPSQTANDPA